MTAASTKSSSILPLAFDSIGYAAAGRDLLSHVSFELAAGVRTVILGPNGAGKSLTLRIAHGLLTPTTGKVKWRGEAQGAQLRQAMVFERAILLRRSAEANVDYALRTRGVPRDARRQRVALALEKTGLTAIAGRAARVLSAGEQQRLALARAWAIDPQVLFLDEPTAALDPAATRAVEELILSIASEGTKIVMTTHDLGQARRIADEVLFFCRGELVEHTAAEAFFEQPASDIARAFIQGDLLW